MLTREEIKGHWTEIKGRLQEQWGQLSDEDLRQALGDTSRLVGTIQQKTGASRREIEQIISNAFHDATSIAERAGEAMSQRAGEAGAVVRENLGNAAGSAAHFAQRASESARRHPGQALAIAFGVGILAGLALAVNKRR